MLLYPRMRMLESKPLIARASVAPLTELEQDQPLLPPRVVWPPTGGTRVSEARLVSLRNAIRDAAAACGYARGLPDADRVPLRTRESRNTFDALLSATLHDHMDISPHEAADGRVWTYVALVVAPEVVRWRFDGPTTTPRRFGPKRTQNVFARCWWRAELFREPEAENQWSLLEGLGEDELFQITDRGRIPGYRPLARELAHGILRVFDPSIHRDRSEVLQQALKRLVRWMAMVRIEALDPDMLEDFVFNLYADTLVGLGYERPSVAERWPRPWHEVSLERRYLFLSQLNATDLAKLDFHRRPELPTWHETEPRWMLLYQIEAMVEDVVATLSPAAQKRVAEQVGAATGLVAWLEELPAGSWSREVDPLRGHQLVHAVDSAVLHELRRDLGWTEAPTRMSELRREFTRRYPGDWQRVIDALPDEEPERILSVVAPGVPTERDPRDALSSWLCRAELPTMAGPAPATDVVPLLAPVGRPVRLDDPLPTPPGLIRALLDALEVRSVGALMRLHPDRIPHVPSLSGKKKLSALWEYRRAVEARVTELPPTPEEVSVPVPEPVRFACLADLDAAAMASLDQRDREIIELRYIAQQTLGEVGDAVGLSRERVRQLAAKRLDELQDAFGAEAQRLLEQECGLGVLGPDVIQRDFTGACSVPFERVALLAELASPDWTVQDDWLVRGCRLDELTRAICDAVDDRDALDGSQLAAVAHADVRFTEELLVKILAREGWTATLDGTIARGSGEQSAGEFLTVRVADEARAVHQREAATWLMERDRVHDDDATAQRYVRTAEAVMSRSSHLWRTGQGLFTHTAALPLTVEDLDSIVTWCVDRIRDTTGPTSTVALLEELDAAGFAVHNVGPHLLKDALGRHPEVRPLRKFMVAFALTFSEEGVHLADRARDVLVAASASLTPAEVHERLPPGVVYPQTSIRQSLSTGGYATHIGGDRYVLVPDADSTATNREDAPAGETTAPEVAFATKMITIGGRAVTISVNRDGSFVVAGPDGGVRGRDVESIQAAVATLGTFQGPRLAIVYKWVTLLAREWAAAADPASVTPRG